MHHLQFIAQVQGLLDPDAAPGADQLGLVLGARRFEAALRDIAAAEHALGPGGAVLIDGVLPRTAAQAVRRPGPGPAPEHWTGDVWRVVPALRARRPDLLLLLIRTTPTGMLLILGGDPARDPLTAAWAGDAADEPVGDGGPVDDEVAAVPPALVLTRAEAVYPAWVVGAPFWSVLRRQRELGTPAAAVRTELLTALQEWSSTTVNDRQAVAIHPGLTGRRGGHVDTRKPAARPAGGVQQRLLTLVRTSGRMVLTRRRD